MKQDRPEARRRSPSGWTVHAPPPSTRWQKRKTRRRLRLDTVLIAICLLGFAAPFTVDWMAQQNLPTIVEVVRLSPARAAAPEHRGPIGICSGPNRAERRVTCIVDGDTGWLEGEKWRMAGIDTPEISKPACAREQQVGLKARDRLRILMSGGYSVRREGTGYYGRTIVSIALADGRDAGAVLLDEGLAQRWPNSGNPWCS
ncbi:thermonuclease family protein [Jiella marina]|uniref:thermonuclease family protein n=1 Tax=Jiella sp. LLJ827 TaxID=2917712 RepID=UPI0021012F91|nr:thermonuclease family protein [Jiella sp. LLJ827]MCQ0990560.1 thermonuclease family protein [Jiella sp. LLJ827]